MKLAKSETRKQEHHCTQYDIILFSYCYYIIAVIIINPHAQRKKPKQIINQA